MVQMNRAWLADRRVRTKLSFVVGTALAGFCVAAGVGGSALGQAD